jgi:hypothetical protein
MGILGNYSVLLKSPGRFLSGTVASGDRPNFDKSGDLRNRFAGDQDLGMAKFSAIPNGYVHPYSWAIAQKSGGLATYTGLSASISETDALLALGVNIDSNLSASFTKNDAILALIVALEANLSASGTFTDTQLAIILLLNANLTGSGSFTDAQLGNILGLLAQLSASMSISTRIINQVNLSADIGGPVELSPQGLSEELLDNQDIETGYSMRESLRLILSSLAGKVSGASGTTITIRDVNDIHDRIIAIVDANGNRTSTTLDASD